MAKKRVFLQIDAALRPKICEGGLLEPNEIGKRFARCNFLQPVDQCVGEAAIEMVLATDSRDFEEPPEIAATGRPLFYAATNCLRAGSVDGPSSGPGPSSGDQISPLSNKSRRTRGWIRSAIGHDTVQGKLAEAFISDLPSRVSDTGNVP